MVDLAGGPGGGDVSPADEICGEGWRVSVWVSGPKDRWCHALG